jgi:hypothetical protein
VSTLRFASRAIWVKNNAHVNEVYSDQTLLSVHVSAVKALKHELMTSEKV